VPAERYEELLKTKKIDNPAQTYYLNKEFPRAKKLHPQDVPAVSPKPKVNLDEFYRDFAEKTKLPMVGGDPEFNLTLQLGKKKLPLDISGFAKKDIIAGAHRDFTVAGGEFSVKPGTPEEVTQRVQKLTEKFLSSFKDPRIKVESLAIHPIAKGSKNQFIGKRRAAGGHLHGSFKRVRGERAETTRLRMQKRIALLHIPIDFTNPAGPLRYGLGKGSGRYGKNIIGPRARKAVKSWRPERGYGNLEARFGPTYVKDLPALEKKLKLMQIAMYHPKAEKLDALANKLWRVTKNKSRGFYHPQVRKFLSSELRKFYQQDLGIKDKWLSDILTKYEKGQTRTLGQ
jgi:hypothetical protein